MGVVGRQPVMTLRALFWTLSSLSQLDFEITGPQAGTA